MSKRLVEDGAMMRATRGFSKIIAVAIVLTVAAFGDVMYIVSMSSKFPSGFLLIFCYLGAFTSFMAVGYLLLGKSVVFRPGGQLLGAWIVFVFELVLIALNILLVFAPHGDGFLSAWSSISPATPVLHMIGVALLFFLDPELRDKHHAMEIQEKMDQSEREVELLTHTARIDLRKRQIGHVSKSLEDAVNSPESLAYIQQFGRKLNESLLTELTGMSAGAFAAPGLPPPYQAPGLPAPHSAYPAGSGAPAGYPGYPGYPTLPPRSVVPSYPSGPLTGELDPLSSGPLAADDAWLEQVNARIAAERAARLSAETGQAAPASAAAAESSPSAMDRLKGMFGLGGGDEEAPK